MGSFAISMDVEPDLHSNAFYSLRELEKFSLLLKRYNSKATFFVTCDCIEKNPALFKKLKKQGHEIALHGYRHERLDSFDYKDKIKQLELGKKCFNKYLGEYPVGFRAVQHSIDNEGYKALKNSKFLYDSSLIPWNFHHIIMPQIDIRFSNNIKSMKIRKMNEFGIYEIPVSSFILPFSSLTLRILPKKMLQIFLWIVSAYKNPIFIMHSWDLIEIPDSKIYNLCPKDKFLKKFEFILDYLSKRAKSKRLKDLIPPVQA